MRRISLGESFDQNNYKTITLLNILSEIKAKDMGTSSFSYQYFHLFNSLYFASLLACFYVL